ALATVLVPAVWHQPVPGAKVAAARLAAAGLRLAVTSNADGRVADMLARHEIVQVGDGPGVPVEHVSDSGAIGVHKPDPGLFEVTARALGLPPGRICHLGDAGGYDADGAAGAGMVAVHADPLAPCPGPPRASSRPPPGPSAGRPGAPATSATPGAPPPTARPGPGWWPSTSTRWGCARPTTSTSPRWPTSPTGCSAPHLDPRVKV